MLCVLVHPGPEILTLFFMLIWALCGYYWNRTGTCHTEVACLQPVGSAGHVVCPGHKTSTHYFSCSCGPGADPTKSASGHITPNLYFCILVRSGRETSLHYFHARWARWWSHKKWVGTHYIVLVFSHPVRSVGHVVHSSVAEAWNIDALFFILVSAPCRSQKKKTGTCYAELVFFCVQWDFRVT
jgi:hypothetical protein